MDLVELLISIPCVLIALTIHEFAHGYTSYKLGDPTPKANGRLSLNPLAHLDVVGTLCLLLFRFGWAKPVMVNPIHYKKPKRDMVLVGLAGPISNLLLAFVALMLARIVGINMDSTLMLYIFDFLIILTYINLGLGIFNLIPLPPLDGFKVMGAFLSEETYFKVLKYEQYGMIVLALLLVSNLLDNGLLMINLFIINIYNNILDIILFFL